MTARYRLRPQEVEACQWTGDNEPELVAFIGPDFMVLDEDDREHCDDPDATASVCTSEHSSWELLYTGGWVLKGVTSGEISVADEEMFAARYEPV